MTIIGSVSQGAVPTNSGSARSIREMKVGCTAVVTSPTQTHVSEQEHCRKFGGVTAPIGDPRRSAGRRRWVVRTMLASLPHAMGGWPLDAQPFTTGLTPITCSELTASELVCLLLANAWGWLVILRQLYLNRTTKMGNRVCPIPYFPKVYISVT
jgi:hypothetical protein